MNYPYNLSIASDLARYLADIKKEPLERQEELRQFHAKMSEIFLGAAMRLKNYNCEPEASRKAHYD